MLASIPEVAYRLHREEFDSSQALIHDSVIPPLLLSGHRAAAAWGVSGSASAST